MDRSSSGARSAPPSVDWPSGGARLPRIDDRLAPPETRIEVLDGRRIRTMAADEPHATQHSQVDAVIRAHVIKDYKVAVDMLTRTSRTSDFAPDVSIFPSAPDPVTRGRRLEELAFEVTSEQRLKVPTDKARKLIHRGVRRVFCVLVKQGRVLEWSRETDGWASLPEGASLKDACLVRALPIKALLSAAAADNEVAEALLVKRPPAIRRALSASKERGRREGLAKGKEEGLREGEAKGMAKAVLAMLEARGIRVPGDARRRILENSGDDELDRWIRRAAVVKKVQELFEEA